MEPLSIMRLNELELFKLSSSNKFLGVEGDSEFRLQNRYITASIDKVLYSNSVMFFEFNNLRKIGEIAEKKLSKFLLVAAGYINR